MKRTLTALTLTAAAIFALSACTINVPATEAKTPKETSSAESPAPAEETPAEVVEPSGGYQEIYDTYSARLQNECPTLSVMECAEVSNEGVRKMAEYMYSASGTDGQMETYNSWAAKLMDVYMAEAR